MSNGNFEKRRKEVETIFDIIFWFYLLEIIGYIVFEILYATGIASIDIFEMKEFVALLVGLCLMAISARLAHKGHIAAGIIGIIVALIQVFFGGTIGLAIGLFLGIDSIMYLINYNKK